MGSFQLYFQATVGNLIGTNGLSAGMPAGQITVIGSITESIVDVTNNGNGTATATFEVTPTQSPNSFLNMYYNGSSTVNPVAGTGYTDGALILSAKPIASVQGDDNTFTSDAPKGPTNSNLKPFDSFNTANYTGIQSVNGSGGYTVNFAVNQSSVNTAFFPSGNPGLISLHLFGGTNAPFTAIDPSASFYGISGGDYTTAASNVPEVVGAINGLSGPDFEFQTNGTLNPVPEPSTLALTLLGFGGVLGLIGRRRALAR